jgi:hypothetical protein
LRSVLSFACRSLLLLVLVTGGLTHLVSAASAPSDGQVTSSGASAVFGAHTPTRLSLGPSAQFAESVSPDDDVDDELHPSAVQVRVATRDRARSSPLGALTTARVPVFGLLLSQVPQGPPLG